jgi:hypothetical protein
MAQKIELSIYASGLDNMAGFLHGTSDLFAVVTKVSMAAGQPPIFVGRKETYVSVFSLKIFQPLYHGRNCE